MKLPFEIDLNNKVAVVTGAGGVLCSMFAEALAKTGAKVALLDLNEEAAKKYAEEITKNGGTAKGYACNVLDEESIQKAHDEIVKDFGTCDILINGAGGNNPKATTDDEYFAPEDIHVYSVDEVFMDVTHYLKRYKMTAEELDVLWRNAKKEEK